MVVSSLLKYSLNNDESCEVIKILERYHKTVGVDAIAFSPQHIIIYEYIKR
jgi:hypothetical protein